MIGIIFKKEIRDMFRDKRVRNAAVVMPVFLIVLMLMLFGFLQDTISNPGNMDIYIVKTGKGILDSRMKQMKDNKGDLNVNSLPSDLRDNVSKAGANLNLLETKSLDEGKQLIQEGKANVVLDFQGSPELGKQEVVNAYYDPKKERSQMALTAIQGLFGTINQWATQKVLTTRNIPSAEAEPFQVASKEVQVGGKSSASEMVVSFLPYMIVVWAFYGGMSTATELVAGEKEKSTLETLLISPATRTQIALGKFLGLCTICLTASLSAFVGLGVAAVLHVSDSMFKNGLGVTPVSLLITIAVLVPTVALFASILLAISSYAKNPREAQTYLAGVSLVVIMPAMFSQFIGFTNFASSTWIYAVPVLSTATLIRQALQSQVNVSGMLLCIVISVVLAAIAIRFAVRLFNRETVLVRV